MDQNAPHSADALQQLLTFRLARLQARANAHAARILKKYSGVSLSEWRVFVLLETNGKITPAQMVRLTQFDKGLISRTVKGMQAKGWVTVETSDSDHRSHLIDFTPEGRVLFEQASPAMRRRQDTLRNTLGPEERAILFGAFDKLDRAFGDMEETL